MPIFVNSMPKSGTNLVSRLLDIFEVPYGQLGIAPTLLLGRRYLARQVLRRSFLERSPCMVGLDVQVPVRKSWLLGRLRGVAPDAYITGHLNWMPSVQEELRTRGFKTVLVVREPLDTLVSYCHYVASTEDHFLHAFFRGRPLAENIRRALRAQAMGEFDFAGFGTMLERIVPWTAQPDVYTVRFEELAGERAGGSREAQGRLLDELGAFTGVRFDQSIVESKLYGTSKTFRRGRIGSAGEELDPETLAEAAAVLDPVRRRLGYLA